MIINPFKQEGKHKENKDVPKIKANEKIKEEYNNERKYDVVTLNTVAKPNLHNINNVDLALLQKYIVSNYMEYLQKGLREILIEKIHLYLYDKYALSDKEELDKISKKLIDKMFGYDILQKYIDSDKVTDIRAVSFQDIYIKELGVWKKTDQTFKNNDEFEEYIRYCVLKNNSNINFDSPIVIVSDKKYNLRIEAGISPVNAVSASIVIRIHRHNKKISLESLFLNDDMLDAKSYMIVDKIIKEEMNLVISGKGGSGKTTLLRAIIDKIPDEKAITINEETTEIYIKGKNVIQREVIQNREGSKKVTLERLMKHSLVNSSDVLVVGELKGEECSNFVDAIATGHVGLATIHSDSDDNTIDRLVTLFKRDIRTQQYREDFVKGLLSQSIDYIIFVKNYRVASISKIEFDKKKSKCIVVNEYKRDEME